MFLCVCVAFCLLPCGVFGAETENRGKCELFLMGGSDANGVFEVAVDVSAESGLCGVLCAVRYDAERLILLSVGSDCGGATFSFADIGGEVRFLIDGTENIGGASVSLFFGLSDGACGEADVEVLFAEAYCFSGGMIDELGLDVPSEVVTIGENGSGREEETNPPTLISWEIAESGGGEYLSVSGRVGDGFFAAGVELFIVRGDGSGVKMLVSEVIALSGDGEFDLAMLLDEGDWHAIVITPVAFCREGFVRGEKRIEVDK